MTYHGSATTQNASTPTIQSRRRGAATGCSANRSQTTHGTMTSAVTTTATGPFASTPNAIATQAQIHGRSSSAPERVRSAAENARIAPATARSSNASMIASLPTMATISVVDRMTAESTAARVLAARATAYPTQADMPIVASAEGRRSASGATPNTRANSAAIQK